MTNLTLLALFLPLCLCGCWLDGRPCPPEQAQKAGDYFKVCIAAQQKGDGGLNCGESAYETFCNEGSK